MNKDGVNVFEDDLKWSHQMHFLPIWKQTYEQAFPGCTVVPPHTQNGDHQKLGIDRTLVLTNSKTIRIDEKARRPLCGRPWYTPLDVLLEYVSNDRTGADGWVVKQLLADYIAYAILQTGQVFLLPVLQVQQAWLKHRVDWMRRYPTKRALNRGYVTLNCPVPVDVLFPAIGSCLRIQSDPMSWEQLDFFIHVEAA